MLANENLTTNSVQSVRTSVARLRLRHARARRLAPRRLHLEAGLAATTAPLVLPSSRTSAASIVVRIHTAATTLRTGHLATSLVRSVRVGLA